MSDDAPSVLDPIETEYPTEGESLENLPTNRKQGQHRVASIYFPTDIPAEQDFEYVNNPEQYLSPDDQQVLKALLGGADVYENGSANDTRVHQLKQVNWRFYALADERGSQEHNYKLALRRARVVGGYLMKLIKLHDANFTSTPYVLPIKEDFDELWRWQVCVNIANGSNFNSHIIGEYMSESEDYPYYRRVDIYATSGRPYDDPNEIPHVCSGYADNEDHWRWNEKDQVKKPPVTVQDFEAPLKARIDHVYNKWIRGEQELSWSDRFSVMLEIRAAIYCYRHHRMLLHELFYGHWNPAKGVDIFGSQAGAAASDLLCKGSTTCKTRYLTQNPFEAGSSIQDSAHNTALQIEHMHMVRVNPFYRAAYLREFPGKNPEEAGTLKIPFLPGAEIKQSWITDITKMLPADQWEFWPIEPWDSVDQDVKTKLTKRNILKSPASQYMTGKEHNKYLKKTGAYKYDDYVFKRGDLDPESSQEWQNKDISGQLKQFNDNYNPIATSHVKHLRDAVREAQTIVKNKANILVKSDEPDFYEIYLEDWRKKMGKPDYTNPREWNQWKQPATP